MPNKDWGNETLSQMSPKPIHRYDRSVAHASVFGRGIVAAALALLALANMTNALLLRPWAVATFGAEVIDLEAVSWGRTEVVLYSVLLLLIARGLVRGKRQAWWLCLGVSLLSLITSWVEHSWHGTVLLVLLLTAALIGVAPGSRRGSDPRALRTGYVSLAIAALCIVLLRALPHLRPLATALHGLTAQQYLLSMSCLRGAVLLAVVYGVTEIFRPVRSSRRTTRAEVQAARSLVRAYGHSATAHFATADDKSLFWSENHRAFISYRLTHGVALALGDPIGPESETLPLLEAFVKHCRAQDWTVAWYLASPQLRNWCRGMGLTVYKMGEEAIIDLAHFTTAGAVGAPIRHAATRARKGGMSVRCSHGEEIPATTFAQMKRVSREWQEQHHASVQMRFSMGRFPADWSRDLLTVMAYDERGVVQAFLTWTPLHQGNGWSLDVMRRTAAAAPGTIELLIVESIAWARDHGDRVVSLGLAPLAGLGTSSCDDVGAEGHGLHLALESLAGTLHRRRLVLGNYASLYRFKAKFQPTWQSRYLVAEHSTSVPHVLSAVMSALGYSWLDAAREVLRARRAPFGAQ